ncbi:hypothetical protein BV25DRAFT_486693 [Artomyces pyxidatus]|uniref:Uncharacterized protein n=1 Tax=Artomyces pyxidatus TaxID=48021 RepID=A0ACB8T2M0_9AGAM|nr:hypothetical protein BV25DRAFT_486693 [Artomyces pyxidatus]
MMREGLRATERFIGRTDAERVAGRGERLAGVAWSCSWSSPPARDDLTSQSSPSLHPQPPARPSPPRPYLGLPPTLSRLSPALHFYPGDLRRACRPAHGRQHRQAELYCTTFSYAVDSVREKAHRYQRRISGRRENICAYGTHSDCKTRRGG